MEKKIKKETTKKRALRVRKEKPKTEEKVGEKPEELVLAKEIFTVDKEGKYWEAVGRRKTAVARVRLFTRGDKEIIVNQKPFNKYFPTPELRQLASAALDKMKCLDKFRILVLAKGGGLNGQAEAMRHGISRALVIFNIDFRKRLKKAGFLTRDARMRERKKFGLKRARRAPQWQKR